MNRNRNRPNSSKGIPRQLSNTTSPTREYFTPPDDWSIVSKIAIAAVSSRGTVGGEKVFTYRSQNHTQCMFQCKPIIWMSLFSGLLAGGLLIKTVGWRFILVAGGFYAAVYMYERLTWWVTARSIKWYFDLNLFAYLMYWFTYIGQTTQNVKSLNGNMWSTWQESLDLLWTWQAQIAHTRFSR